MSGLNSCRKCSKIGSTRLGEVARGFSVLYSLKFDIHWTTRRAPQRWKKQHTPIYHTWMCQYWWLQYQLRTKTQAFCFKDGWIASIVACTVSRIYIIVHLQACLDHQAPSSLFFQPRTWWRSQQCSQCLWSPSLSGRPTPTWRLMP